MIQSMMQRAAAFRSRVLPIVAVCALLPCGCNRRQHSPTAAPPSYKDPVTGREGFVLPRTPSPLFEPERAGQLMEPARDRWQQPARLVNALGLKQGQSVADIGSGSGYLLRHLSRAVGRQGLVYAQEIQKAFLPALRREARRLGNVRVIEGTAADTRLPERGIDCFVMLTVYHEVVDAVRFLRSLKKAARPGSRLAIIDFDAYRGGDPPAPAGHEMADVTVIAEARAAGWRLVQRHEFLSSQFFLVFEQGLPH